MPFLSIILLISTLKLLEFLFRNRFCKMDFVAKETEVIGQEKLLVELALELICQGGGEISVTGGFAEGERQRSVWNV